MCVNIVIVFVVYCIYTVMTLRTHRTRVSICKVFTEPIYSWSEIASVQKICTHICPLGQDEMLNIWALRTWFVIFCEWIRLIRSMSYVPMLRHAYGRILLRWSAVTCHLYAYGNSFLRLLSRCSAWALWRIVEGVWKKVMAKMTSTRNFDFSPHCWTTVRKMCYGYDCLCM